MAGSAHGGGTEARALPAALTMTSAPAAASTADLADLVLPVGLVLPAAADSVEAALAAWAAAPVLAEPGAAAAALAAVVAPAASAAWAAAAAMAVEPDADADADADSITKKAPCFEQKHGAFCFISAGYCP